MNELIDSDNGSGIIEIHKDMDLDNWVSLKRSSSALCSSSAGKDSLDPCSIEYEMNIVGIDE